MCERERMRMREEGEKGEREEGREGKGKEMGEK